MRKTIFANGEFYHIYNRGVDKREVFLESSDYLRFITAMHLMNDTEDGLMFQWKEFKRITPQAKLSDFLKLSFEKRQPLIEVVAYCLNPNHYHFILRQVKDKGVERFMHKVGTSYTKYFNKKYERSGSLFQGTFKSILIDSNEYLLYLSAYVNKNNYIHGYRESEKHEYSSLQDYLGIRNGSLCHKDIVLGQFKNFNEYETYLNANAQHLKEQKELEFQS